MPLCTSPLSTPLTRTSPTGLNSSTLIGNECIVEPGSVLRSCRLEGANIVGARSVLCEGSMMEFESVLAPGSVLPPARRVPAGELWGGNPARFIRQLTPTEVFNHYLFAEHTHKHRHFIIFTHYDHYSGHHYS
jgi:carbonic anhydrase/acetyltransferase-like protein (isoleucine patch superfamily)